MPIFSGAYFLLDKNDSLQFYEDLGYASKLLCKIYLWLVSSVV